MKILITGGAGFIGSHTADALIEAGHQVRILDNLQRTVHPKGLPAYLNREAEFICGDVRDADAWKKALAGVQAVFHLAAYQDYLPDFSTFFGVNSVSTALLYEILAAAPQQYRVQKIIVATSQAVMGEGRYHCPACDPDARLDIYPEIRPADQLSRGQWNHLCPQCTGALQWLPSDESVVRPCNPYALSKYSQEQIAIQFGRRCDIPSVAMRYSIVQGPRQSFYNAYSGAMRIFALSLLFGRPPVIYEDGLQIRDFIHIGDVVAANLLVLTNPAADYQVYNVGGGIAWTVSAFYDAMQTITGKHLSPRMEGLYRFGDTRHIFSDTQRLRSLGWSAARTVDNSIRDYWDYLLAHQDKADILAYAEKQMKQLNVVRRSGVAA